MSILLLLALVLLGSSTCHGAISDQQSIVHGRPRAHRLKRMHFHRTLSRPDLLLATHPLASPPEIDRCVQIRPTIVQQGPLGLQPRSLLCSLILKLGGVSARALIEPRQRKCPTHVFLTVVRDDEGETSFPGGCLGGSIILVIWIARGQRGRSSCHDR